MKSSILPSNDNISREFLLKRPGENRAFFILGDGTGDPVPVRCVETSGRTSLRDGLADRLYGDGWTPARPEPENDLKKTS